ncbi:toxin-activating lysine-acyltransferase [Novosphingobium flavum]|uniref:RTX toxin-activating lysine-acyltransferase n=1 Tax=Novosphingobium aerophilum TaxID=2839843 RepID=A0A7X1FAM7_9SPHN|nr:toxin-activating lysine-acyltransferase [Novosphingobium aerophilum]MBC2653492.1 toxin-activating lysine-acyltransferase [Novosphingobium aerophilum]MBC2663653.1 toxin-activating lysine-acyltransferase [Novosphingobium aerophilum]
MPIKPPPPKRAKPGSKAKTAAPDQGSSAVPPTVSHLLGEMTWLLTQSPLHKAFAIGDLEWLVMPALIHQQFYLFRDGAQPVGLALWAKCNPTAVGKLQRGMVDPQNRLTLEEWQSGDEVWLVDLVAPFATPENRQREIMIADLISKPLKGTQFHFHQTDPETGQRMVRTVEADAGERLAEVVRAATEATQLPTRN